SFQNRGFWTKNVGGLPDNEIQYDSSSRIEPKRPHHWFLEASDREFLSSKKSAVEGSYGRPISGVPNMNLSWETPSSLQSSSSHLTDRLFGLDIQRTIDFGGSNFQPVNAGNLDIGRRGIEDQYGNDASIALSMSHTMENPGSCLTYGGIRKVKVNQVRDSDNGMSMQMGDTPSRCDFNSSFNRFQDEPSANQAKGSESGMSMLMGNSISFNGYQEAPEINQFKDSDSGVPLRMNNSFNNSISFNGFQEAPYTNPQPCSPNQVKDSGNGMSIQLGNSFNRFDNNTISFRGFQEEHVIDAHSGRLDQVKDNGNIMSVQLGNSFSKGHLSTISFGGIPKEPENSSYDLLRRQSSLQQSEDRIGKEAVDKTATELVVNATPLSAVTGKNAKTKNELKASKKMLPNSFPSNVRSLLNTGMLDGVPVKYVSWQQERELIGIIQGTGYVCGCESCNYSKVINAYEFEKHAGGKTKHPNNHIYFDNGKTIYTIVQELKSTPNNLLFEAIQTCTGSVINQKAFESWKVSFQAATRELERIYGKELLEPSQSDD
ncbi:hypothetical protein AQUCO_03900011v1, partial [Aquilegia coerulea]